MLSGEFFSPLLFFSCGPVRVICSYLSQQVVCSPCAFHFDISSWVGTYGVFHGVPGGDFTLGSLSFLLYVLLSCFHRVMLVLMTGMRFYYEVVVSF